MRIFPFVVYLVFYLVYILFFFVLKIHFLINYMGDFFMHYHYHKNG